MSKFWAGGTVFAAAMTPVVVSIIKELLERPMQSEVVRRSASRVTDVAVARRAIAGGAAARTERERERSPATGTVPPPSANGSGGGDDEVTQGDVVLSHPRRTYGAAARRRLSPRALKIGIVTGLLAFVLAAVALTVPELLFGGSVGSGDRSTTIFGGGKDSRSGEERDSDGATQQPGSQEQPSGEGDEAAPGPAPAPEDEAAPESEEPAPAEPPASEPAPAPVPAPTTP